MPATSQQKKTSDKFASLFKKMSMSELPAMSTNVQQLISLTCSSRSAATQLTKVILKDYSLTNKLLQVVNSAYYSLGQSINSVSRAVAVLGFDAVRDMATSIALFEEFIKSGLDKEGISKLLTKSFLSALQARDMVVEKGLKVTPEEVFICTLLHNLGRIVVCIYLPEKYREIEEKMSHGIPEKVASKAVLDNFSYLEIGEEIAKFWNLADQVASSMNPEPTVPLNSYDKVAYLNNVAFFSNTLIDCICDGSDLNPILDKYGKMFSVDAEELVGKIQNCIEESEDVSDSLRYGLNKLKIRSRVKMAVKNIKVGVLSSVKPSESRNITGSNGGDADAAISGLSNGTIGIDELPDSHGKSVNDFIRDITETLMGDFSLNDFYASLLEGLYRGVGFDRVILSIVSVTPSKVSLIGRFGLGDIELDEVKKIEHIIAKGPYAIPNSLRLCKDMMVSGKKLEAFPANLHYLVKGRNIYLFPICIDQKGIGMIYLDRKAERDLLDKENVKNVRLFRDFAVMAIKKLRANK